MSIHLAGCNEKIKGNCGYITVEKYVVYIINEIDGNLDTFNEFRKMILKELFLFMNG